ncbi:ATP-binding protein [Streptomyces sp. NPDC059679]|uniref:ATP-binding protein n=1 Tax=Streptomyces sp. NPDC059679 TaxID=3346903 RepID=UPI0036B7594E
MAGPSPAITRPSAIGAPAYTEVLTREPDSAARARRLVRTVLETWHLPHLVNDAMLITSELVSNTINHARGSSIRFTVTRIGECRVRIAVVDKSHAKPVLRTTTSSEERGRGLAIVDALAVKWGVDPLPWGKRVWAECALPSEDVQ